MRRALIPALLLVACGGAAPAARAPAPRPAAFAAGDLTLPLPSGWQAAQTSLTPNLALPREVVAVATYPLRYRRMACAHMPVSALADMPPHGAFVSLFELPHASAGFPPRPRRFGPEPNDRSDARGCAPRARFTDHWLTFRDHGRAFYALVAFGPRATARTRATAWGILDGLKVGRATVSIGEPQPDGSLLAPGLRGSPGYRLTTENGCVDVRAIADRTPWCGAPLYVKRLAGITAVAGIAPHGDVVVDGHRLPLTREHAFLALTSERNPHVTASGRTLSTTRRRPPGTVFNDEIGEDILQRTRAEIVERFGAPAATGDGCDYYRQAGDDRRRGWRFCYRADGVMTGASGNLRLPSK